MATLGDAFSPDVRRASITRQLQPGAVIKLCERMDDGNEQEKRFVVLSVTAITVCFVVNSEMNEYVQQREHLARNHVLMPQADHGFMTHDSYVDCAQLKSYSTAHVISELMDKADWVLGTINLDLRDRIVATLNLSSTIPLFERVPLCQALATMT